MGRAVPNPDQPMEGYLSPPILVGQARKRVLNSPTPFLVDDNLSIEKTWMTLC